MIAFVVILLLLALIALTFAVYRIEYLQHRLEQDTSEKHALCIAAAIEAAGQHVSNHYAYEVLYEAAAAYDTPGEQARARMLGQNRRTDAPSVPALWMMERGHIIRSRDDE